MKPLRFIDSGGHYGDLDLRGKNRNEDTGLIIKLKAGEVAEFGNIKTRNLFNPIIKIGAGKVVAYSVDNQEFGGDGIQCRSSGLHIKYTNVENVTPTRPYKVCIRLGNESIRECLARNNEEVYDPDLLEWTAHPAYKGKQIIAACHVDAVAQFYATKDDGYTLNPHGIITDVHMPHVRARIDHPKVQIFMGSENCEYSGIYLGTETYDVNAPYINHVVFNTLNNSKIGCDSAKMTDGACVKILEVKPRPAHIPADQVRTHDNEIKGFRDECIIEECTAENHSHSVQGHPLTTKKENNPMKSLPVYDMRGNPVLDNNGNQIYSNHEESEIKKPAEPMEISKGGIQTLIKSEGSKSKPYYCTARCLTIGVGHALTKSEITSGKIQLHTGQILDYRNNGLDRSQIELLLRHDLIRFNDAVNHYVKVPLKQHEFDALVHFSFNVGVTAFKNSTLLKLLNQGLYDEVPRQIRRWVKQPELKGRREVEVEMWLGDKFNYVNIENYDVKPKTGILKEAVKAAKSRTIKGAASVVVAAGTAAGSGAGFFSTVLSDPAKAVETVQEGSKAAAESLPEIVENVGSVAGVFGFDYSTSISLLATGFIVSMIIILAGAGWVIYARYDDHKTNRNPISSKGEKYV